MQLSGPSEGPARKLPGFEGGGIPLFTPLAIPLLTPFRPRVTFGTPCDPPGTPSPNTCSRPGGCIIRKEER